MGYVQSVDWVVEFVTGARFSSALEEIGGTEMDAAKFAVSQWNDPGRTDSQRHDDLRSAITHLESAHSAFRRSWKKGSIGEMFSGAVAFDSAERDLLACLTLAKAHAYLGDEAKVNELIWLMTECRAELLRMDDATFPGSLSALASVILPHNWKAMKGFVFRRFRGKNDDYDIVLDLRNPPPFHELQRQLILAARGRQVDGERRR